MRELAVMNNEPSPFYDFEMVHTGTQALALQFQVIMWLSTGKRESLCYEYYS